MSQKMRVKNELNIPYLLNIKHAQNAYSRCVEATQFTLNHQL